MPDREKVIKWLEYDYLPRVGAYRKDCKQGCDACMPMHDGDNYCDIDMLWKILALLNGQEAEGNKWVKCSDGMPEEQETIFAKFKGTEKWNPAMFVKSSEDVRVVIVFADGTRGVSHSHTIDGKWECERGPLKRTVTHWMPNPKLPKEGC